MLTASVRLGLATKLLRLTRSRLKNALLFTFSTFAGLVIVTGGKFNPFVGVLAPLSMFALMLGVYLLNDYSDLDVDLVNAPNRPLASQAVTKRETLGFILFLNSVGITIAFFLGWLAFSVALLEVLLGVVYSIKPFNFKDVFILKTLTVGAGGILANIYGGLSAGIVNSDLLFCSLIFLVFIFSTSPLNDLADYTGDKLQNRKTIPIVIGAKKTIALSAFMSVVPPVFALILFDMLRLNMVSIVVLSLVAARCIQLLLPIMKSEPNLATVKKQHRKMYYLHFLVQGAIMLGCLPL